jgi:hypothetical protein
MSRDTHRQSPPNPWALLALKTPTPMEGVIRLANFFPWVGPPLITPAVQSCDRKACTSHLPGRKETGWVGRCTGAMRWMKPGRFSAEESDAAGDSSTRQGVPEPGVPQAHDHERRGRFLEKRIQPARPIQRDRFGLGV